jgi:3-methyladenine DNA glycosylase AlkD
MTTTPAIIAHLHTLASERIREGKAHFGINASAALGISMPVLRDFAKTIKQACKADKISPHELALELWGQKFHEAQLLAILIENAHDMTLDQIESWVRDLDSWDTCDQLCGNLLWKRPEADALIAAWCADEAEFVRRAGFALIATSAVHDKKAPDARFHELFPLIEEYAFDERNFVKKAVNWAIRQIGKRNPTLRLDAIALSERVHAQAHKSARWIANDALRELREYEFRKKHRRTPM